MDTLQRTLKILSDAETALAALASESAKESKYDVATSLIDLARDVGNLSSKARAQLDAGGAATGQPGEVPQSSSKAVAPSPRSSIKSHSKKMEYPKFLRVGDNLVKLGWSPSEKAEYEHKSPKQVLLLLVGAIRKIGANSRRFSMDSVLPLVDSTDGVRVPDYQAYLCLAWLKTLGFLTQHGRKGYSLTTRAPIEPLIETHWGALPTR